MAKHTPGPWVVSLDRPPPELAAGGGWYVEDPFGITALIFGEHGNPEHEANARLVAEAPTVLAALQDLVEQLDAIGICDWHGAEGLCLDAARAAIAKAK